MFKDKELHSAVARLINRFADFCVANNESVKNMSTNFQYIGDQLTSLGGKLTDIQELHDKLDNQAHILIAVVDERNSYQRQLEDTRDELQQVRVQLSDEKLYATQMEERIQLLEQKLDGALKSRDAWKTTYESEIEGLQAAISSRGQTIIDQSRKINELAYQLDSFEEAYKELSNAQDAASLQPVQPAQPAGFNIQELANELSKYLTAPAVVEDTGLPTTGFNNSDSVQKYLAANPSTGMGQDYSAPVMPTPPIGDTAVGNSVGVAASVLQPRSYIPSPSTYEPDAILSDNILAADPEVMARIPKTPGPVLLPSQAQYAYQVAELVADGAQYLPPVPTVPTQG